MIKNQYEIMQVTSEMELVRYIRVVCIEKAKKICEYISKKTGSNAYFYLNVSNNEIEIYTERKNIAYAISALKDFEFEYDCVIKRNKMIAQNRHNKKNKE